MVVKASTGGLLLVVVSSDCFGFLALVLWLSACCCCCLLQYFVAAVPQRSRSAAEEALQDSLPQAVKYEFCTRHQHHSCACVLSAATELPQRTVSAGMQKQQLWQHASRRLPCKFSLGGSSPSHSL